MTAVAALLQNTTGAPILANYRINPPLQADKFTTLKQLWETKKAIICWDEIHTSADSRMWKDNISISRFIVHTRKKQIILLYTAQHLDMVDKRLRNLTDFLVQCDKKKDRTHVLQFVEMPDILTRKVRLVRPDRVYPLYDTSEEIWGITATAKKANNYDGFNQ